MTPCSAFVSQGPMPQELHNTNCIFIMMLRWGNRWVTMRFAGQVCTTAGPDMS